MQEMEKNLFDRMAVATGLSVAAFKSTLKEMEKAFQQVDNGPYLVKNRSASSGEAMLSKFRLLDDDAAPLLQERKSWKKQTKFDRLNQSRIDKGL